MSEHNDGHDHIPEVCAGHAGTDDHMNSLDTANLSVHDQLDVLISRVVDGQAVERDMQVFRGLAQRVPDAWEQLALAQREHTALSAIVAQAELASERVELPSREGAARFLGAERFDEHRSARWSQVRAWGGWAAAAVVGLAWFTGGVGGFQSPLVPQGASKATIVPTGWQINTPEDAVQAYLKVGAEQGKVLGEAPGRVKIDQRPTPDGKGIEVTYLRQFIERVTVQDMFQTPAADESGRPLIVKVQPGVRAEPQ